ncbi:MAG: insulinase family protein [Sphingobacteriia bacterium]|nr:insulinase family protein [Sphingobacteriia bacterium]
MINLNEKIHTLDNGIVLLTEHIPNSYTLAIRICFKFGSRYEPVEKKGIAHFLEHMLFKGTSRRTSKDIVEEVDLVGGDINAFTGRENTVYTLTILNEHLELGLDILSDILINSTFPLEEIEKERQVILQEIAQYVDEPEEFLFDSFFESTFKNQPLGHNILGTIETVNNIHKEDLLKFVNEFYVADNVIISIAGDLSKYNTPKLVNKFFASMPSNPKDKSFIKSSFTPSFLSLKRELEQSHYIVGYKGVGSLDEDYYNLQLISIILGGGMSSRLFQEIREKQALAYSIGSYTYNYSDTGLIIISASTIHEKIPQLNDGIINVIKSMSEIQDKELEKAKKQYTASLKMAYDSITSRANFLLNQYLKENKVVTIEELLKKIDNIRLVDLYQTFERIFTKPEISLGILGETFENTLYEAHKNI